MPSIRKEILGDFYQRVVEGDNPKKAPVLSVTIEEVIMEPIKGHIKSLVDRAQAGFRYFSIDHINILRNILEQCAEFRS